MQIWWTEQVLMFANPYHCILHSQYLIQMKLFSTATLGTEKSGHCREVVVVEAETTVNVRTVRLKKNGRCTEVAVMGG